MKKKTLFSAVLVIALCLSMVVGSTFALLTTEQEFNISINSAKVGMTASVDTAGIKLYSAVPAGADAQQIIEDEYGNKYVYQQQTDSFLNGGSAGYKDGTFSLSLITPGDKVEFSVGGENTGDIAVKSRLLISCDEGQALMEGLVITVNGVKFTNSSSYATEWQTIEVGEKMEGIVVTIELPVSANNDYQGLTASILVTVESVQENGKI
ncbi:MAG: hypothetical protein E7350_04865 [Clostridiales bacterium]|nr:hypothetical protein [Clostridiales bacterium]